MGEHHEATVNLAGSGNEPAEAAPEPKVIRLEDTFSQVLNDIVEKAMEQMDELREKHNIPRDQFPGILHITVGSYPDTYMSWVAYKEDPEGYMEAVRQAHEARPRNADGDVILGDV
jgi:hypothetical protein